MDTALLGRRDAPAMFSYDAALAVSLGEDLDPASLLA